MKTKIVNTLILLLVASLTSFSQAKIKVLDKSTKKIPTWVNATQTDYIITSAISDDLEKAKNQCLENVKKYAIESVAENVKSSAQGQINQQMINNEIVNFLDEYKSSYNSQSADVPFMKGISISKVEDYYWEKRQKKDTKEITYLYAIKYPMPSVELKRMIREFEKRDEEIYGQYSKLSQDINNIASVEQIDKSINDLKPIIAYFFDDTRKNAAKTLQDNYRKLYDNIVFNEISNELGEHRFHMLLNGKVITCSQRVTLKSDCASEVAVSVEGNENVVRYNYSNCIYNEENSISVIYRINGKSVPYKFFFSVKKFAVSVEPEKTVFLSSPDNKESILKTINIRMPIRSGHNNPYTIKSLVLEVPGLSEPLFLDEINQTFKTKEANLNVKWEGEVEKLSSQNNTLNIMRGSMEVEIPAEKINKRVTFSIPFKANW